MLSETFKVDAAPYEAEGYCVHRKSTYNNEWTYTKCDKVADSLCFDCAFGHSCIACSDCKAQCEPSN
ncbi:hypothetical protein IF2G_00165 [Cordyceps javanica]|nr:hypothetical protein IF2G_00165 [Cordyceps javanica]